MVVNTNPETDTNRNPVSKSQPTEFSARQERKQGYWHIVWRQLMKNKFAVIGLYCVTFLILVAIFADFLANDKPLIIK